MTIKFKRKLIAQIREYYRKGLSLILVAAMWISSFIPFSSVALTGGPSQPEVQGFTPIGTSDMVDVFSGDFKYNIPLLSIDGYPINIAYSGNVSMDQEASWVGLGWSLNVGTVNRTMRGIPDDFDGEQIITTTSMKPNKTFGANPDFLNFELFGLEKKKNNVVVSSLGISTGMGVTYNNYTGIGLSLGLDISGGIGMLNGGLGLNSSSDNGLSIQPNVSLNFPLKQRAKSQGSLSGKIGVGGAFNSRAGLQQLSINTSIAQSGMREIKQTVDGEETVKYKKGSSSLGITGSTFALMQPTFTPQISQNITSTSISGDFKVGSQFFANFKSVSINGSYSEQRITKADQVRSNKAYGYMYTQDGQDDSGGKSKDRSTSILDFNRENDGSFSNETKTLPLTNYTYDLFNVSGQGVGGSFRPFRSEIGYVFDPFTQTRSGGGDISVELGVGATAHTGGSIAVNVVTARSGKWSDDNDIQDALKYHDTKPYDDYENFYMKEANELNVTSDPDYINRFGGYQPTSINLKEISNYNTKAEAKLTANGGGTSVNVTQNYRDKRERRNQTMQFINRQELEKGYGIGEVDLQSYDGADHHIAEVTSLGSDGSRYVYGIAAYNKKQEEVSFSIGKEPVTGNNLVDSNNPPNCNTGLVDYSDDPIAASVENNYGVSNYFNKVETPAYAHSYLLTAIISPDYVDTDGIKGPSEGDIGSYTRFHYKKNAQDYNWRVPLGEHIASYQAGLSGDLRDDKANFVYGEKELWYIDKIETKNFIALFERSARLDACGVVDKDGLVDQNNNMQKLDKITLYAKPDYGANGTNAIPIKEVHFVYDYELCPGVPNNINFLNQQPTNTGKLTLKEVYFTYRGSFKGKLSPYTFEYQNNYGYNLKGYDRWGCYKPNNAPAVCNDPETDPLSTSEFPYVAQDDKATLDQYMSAWTMNQVNLPSGGSIDIEYESDDYACVQDRNAMQMFKIAGVSDDNGNFTNSGDLLNICETGINGDKNKKIYFELDPSNTTDLQAYVEGINDLYFKCLMHYPLGGDDFYEYVSGYATIDESSLEIETHGGIDYGCFRLEGTSLKDKATGDYNPIARTAAQFGRLYLSQYIWTQPFSTSNQTFGGQYINALINVYANLIDGFRNPNKVIITDHKGTDLVKNKSWIRLNNVSGAKLGGGNRVKSVIINDNWDVLAGSGLENADYGQTYSYTNEDGSSSGVAAYEPQIGGEENPFKQPDYYAKENRMAPDDRFYHETPYGESFFPSASVGYSRVVVKNLERQDLKRHATGFVEHTFYTAKDFPTITKRTGLKADRDKTNPFGIQALLKVDNKDYLTASQGFYIETNDMHGKPRTQNVYQEDRVDPITSVEYKYQSEIDSDLNVTKLNNQAQVINPDGSNSVATIGVHFDAVADMRENKTDALNAGLNVNLDAFPIGILFSLVPTVWPSYNRDRTQFRSAVMTKVVQRFGILEETIASDLGSTVRTKNLAYDGVTGEVLLTETATNFEDAVYTLKYPAYWYYDQMGAAYQNLGIRSLNVNFNAGEGLIANAQHKYVPGDELILDEGTSTVERGWVVDVGINKITVMLVDGSFYSGNADIKIIRSGRRNQQMNPMASITSRTNPLSAFESNVYENVIQASAIEFTDDWRTYCDCFTDQNGDITSTNPYVLGTKGNWRPITSYLHLSGRTQSNFNNNTDIRNDGVFTSYRPFYKLSTGNWIKDKKDWTYTAEVTEFNPFGQELENRDALGRYSAATFGFNQTLATSVAANARYREIGFDSFEDYPFSNCADKHFKLSDDGFNVVGNQSHSGNYSLKVSAGSDVSMHKDIEWCDKPSCDIAFTFSQQGEYTIIQPAGGSGQYILDWDQQSGDAEIIYSPSASTISYQTSENGMIEITVIDSEGCAINANLVFNNGQYTIQ